MSREELINLIVHTMKYYGSDETERESPGSKIQAQAGHIADVVAQYDEAKRRCRDLPDIRVCLDGFGE